MSRAGRHLQTIGVLETSKRIDLAIGLPLRNREALANLWNSFTTASPNYHKYLTPQAVANGSAHRHEYQAVIDFAKIHHLSLAAFIPSHDLDVSGAVPDLEQALHLKLRRYQHPPSRAPSYSPDVEPSLERASGSVHCRPRRLFPPPPDWI